MRKILMACAVVLAVVLLTHAGAGTAQAWSPGYHIVQPGQTLYSIAASYGLSSWALANANGLWNPNYIYVGQMLVIPSSGYCYSCYRRPYVNYYPAQYYSPMPSYPGYPQPTYGCNYRVTYGDTMTNIAVRYGTTAWNLARANNIYNANWIYVGQMLFIPGCN